MPPELQARVHLTAGFLDMANPARAREENDAAMAKFAELGPEEEVAEARISRLIPVVAEGEPAAFIRLIEELGAFYEPRPGARHARLRPTHL